ncbi:MAG: lytic transglycosylase domain-containing protein [Phaeodactylibacter sp.]|nr:lytic transglycosylase domain-containing protein [Phaeodactylibacter sp.]MCB9264461.1 lytic transglycosylase domain-containing protein [Lewinellaceae bacterium]MCB9286198.1 lytic transglycosylase domain-containing protein [Lewinellaceae bacterium]
MRALALALTLLSLPALSAAHENPQRQLKQEAASWPEQLSYDIPLRLLQIPVSFPVEYTAEVRRQITDYLQLGRRETEKMLARTSLYFPIIEHYLQEFNLPDELKYIPLLESRLIPTAESPVGALGLWQFMPATAGHYQLQIDEYVDERMNPYQATEAALRMLAGLHRDFGDWSLALAAYNCGPGRVRSAIRQTGCHNFWDIEHLLPRQTQRYLPALIATIYVANYFRLHGLSPDPKKLHQPFQVFKVQHSLNLADIARHCKVTRRQLHRLNPGFLQDFIPHSGRGRYLILPEKALPDFQKYIIKESRKSKESFAIAVLNSHHYQPAAKGARDRVKKGIRPKADI